MISNEIIKAATNIEHYGLINKPSHSSNLKNKICGDKIKIQLKVKNNQIEIFKYKTESCVFCQASASILASKASFISISSLKKDTKIIYDIIDGKKNTLPKNFSHFKIFLRNQYKNRSGCIMLPFNALIKALKIWNNLI